MVTVADYCNGRILTLIRLAHRALDLVSIPVFGPVIRSSLEQRMKSSGIRAGTVLDAMAILEASDRCATGFRICLPLFPDTAKSEAVFLDELADAMAGAGKARIATKEKAAEIIRNHARNPLILSKVSGKYLEICCSDPGSCIYWRMKNYGLKF